MNYDLEKLEKEGQKVSTVLDYLCSKLQTYRFMELKDKEVCFKRDISLSSITISRTGTILCVDHNRDEFEYSETQFQSSIHKTRVMMVKDEVLVQDNESKTIQRMNLDDVIDNLFSLSTILSREALDLLILCSYIKTPVQDNNAILIFPYIFEYVDEMLEDIRNGQD